MKVLNQLVFAVFTLSLAMTANAQIQVPAQPVVNEPAKCVSKTEMQEIARDFKQFAPQANADYCFDGSQVSNLIASLMFMRHTAFAPAMNPSADELFTGRFAKSWYQYFIGRINTLEIVASCPKGVVAYVYSFGGKTMYACPLALTDTFSALDRASVFMHEARHIDGYPHITCSKGPRQGLSGACDKKIADGGSYAVTVETYAQIAKYATELHPALKAYARSSATVYADEAFETPVKIDRTENLLILNSALQFQTLNLSTGEVKSLGQAKAPGHIIHRAQHLVIFPDDKTLKSEYIFAQNEGSIEQSPGDVFVEYNNQTPEEKANLVDFHSGAQWSARVYKNSARLACDPNSATVTDLQMPAGQVAANLIYVNGYSRGVYSTNLVMQSGDVYELGCANKKAYLKAATNVKLDQKYKRLYKVANQIVGLTEAGTLFSVEGGKSSPLKNDFGTIIEIVPFETFNFFETAQ